MKQEKLVKLQSKLKDDFDEMSKWPLGEVVKQMEEDKDIMEAKAMVMDWVDTKGGIFQLQLIATRIEDDNLEPLTIVRTFF